MIKLNKITFEDNGKLINYDYSISAEIQKFFEKNQPYYAKYNEDISKIPASIAVIPFLSNFITIAWFAGFTIEVDEIDKDFYNTLLAVKEDFKKWYPNNNLKGKVVANKIVPNQIKGNKKAMLFSGGVDAFATYIRHYKHSPDLVTIHGADIAIEDIDQWNDLKYFIENEPLLVNNNKKFITSNVRDFYTYNVNLLIDSMSWWGKIQHGLSLLGIVAPLSYINKYKSIAIASSYTEHIDISWGSTPETDEKISWAGIQIIHDGYELKRQDKVDLISEFVENKNQTLRLRVCYSELRDQFNCSNCEKCYRTILGIVLTGQNPNNFGFEVDENFYKKMFEVLDQGSASKGMKYFWWELMEKAKIAKNPYIFNNREKELNQIKNIAEGKIDRMLIKQLVNKKTTNQRLKFILINKFSSLYNLYKKIRY